MDEAEGRWLRSYDSIWLISPRRRTRQRGRFSPDELPGASAQQQRSNPMHGEASALLRGRF